MCTAIISVDPGSDVPVLLAGVRDELAARPWAPPGRHWPHRPDLIGGVDLQAGGTWLAVRATGRPAVACVLNGLGMDAPTHRRRSRGELPLLAAGGQPLLDDLTEFDPFHLITAEPSHVALVSWDGMHRVERVLGPGLHIVVNSGLPGLDVPSFAPAQAVAQMAARVAYFRPRLQAATRPRAGAGSTAQAWGDWLPLLDGGGLDPADRRAMILRRDLEDGRVYGTGSVSAVALRREGVRYDFTATPGAGGWYQVQV